MTAKKSYWELLRDPRWQRMRLEIMERDGFKCLDCGADDKTLNVHHTYYAKGRKPWEYEPASLRTLCEDCHTSTSTKLAEAARLTGKLPPEFLDELLGYLRWTVALNVDPDDAEKDILIDVENVEQVNGVRMAAGLTNPFNRMTTLLRDMAERSGGKLSVDSVIQLVAAQGRRRREAHERGEEII